MKKIWWLSLALLIIISLIVEFTMHHHFHHWWSDIPAFWIYFGFVGCLVLILFAKLLGKLLVNRKEDYYDV